MDLGHTDVVKSVGRTDEGASVARTIGAAAGSALPAPATHGQIGAERGTRARIARLILENGPVTAAALSTRLGLTPAAVRRHLDNLLADGLIETRTARRHGQPGPRPPGQAVRDHRRRPQRVRARLRRPGHQRAAVPGRGGRAGRGRRVRPAAGGRAGAQVPAGGGIGRARPSRVRRPGRGAVRRTATPPPPAARQRAPGESSSASTTARWRTWPPSSRSCARRRPRPSAGCSARPCSGWPPSPTATASAPRT